MAAKRSPRNATTAGSGQRYYSWRNERMWSVTTIVSGGVPKPVLVNWAKKFTAEYAVDNFEALTALVKTQDRQGAVDWLKNAAYRDRDRAADIGTQVHAAAEAYRLGKPSPPWPLEIKSRMDAFVAWCEDFRPTFEMVEASVFNRTEHYAGTLDAIVVINGQRLLLDYKSSRTGIYAETVLQTAAYRYAEFIGMPDGTEHPMPEVDGCAALWLPGDPEKTQSGRPYDFLPLKADLDAWNFFRYAREVFRWMQLKRGDVIGEPLNPTIADALPDVAAATLSLNGVE